MEPINLDEVATTVAASIKQVEDVLADLMQSEQYHDGDLLVESIATAVRSLYEASDILEKATV